MFVVGDKVRQNNAGQDMTVEAVEKCLDCNRVVVSCCWLVGTDLHRDTFKAKELTKINMARHFDQILREIRAQVAAQWATPIWTGQLIIDDPDPEPAPAPVWTNDPNEDPF